MDSTLSIPVVEKRTATDVVQIPVFVYATVFASMCIIVGLIWDISWHTSIGRDGLLSPPHLAMYVGAIVSGVFSGYQILKTSFFGIPPQPGCLEGCMPSAQLARHGAAQRRQPAVPDAAGHAA